MNSKKLDSAQRKYVEKRLMELVEQRTQESLKRCTAQGRELSPEERAAAIRSGKAQLKKSVTSIDRYIYVKEAFQFADERPTKVDNEKHLKEVIQIKRTASAIMDELMLVDAETALERLRKFEAGK